MSVRSRLAEFSHRVLREEMLTKFNHTAKITQLELSIVLHGSQAMNEVTKYKSACLLEILCGQRPMVDNCEPEIEDPHQANITIAQRKELERARGKMILASMQKGKGGGVNKKTPPKNLKNVTPTAEMKKLGKSIKIATVLHGDRIMNFLDKLHEFYLPDIGDEAPRFGGAWRPPQRGHENSFPARGIALHFQKKGGSTKACYPSRYPLHTNENPLTAISCYSLKSNDLLKFPDIEIHFEALGSILGGMKNESTNDAVRLIMRPTVQLHCPLNKQIQETLPKINTLKVMNYFLSHYFNAYLDRPHLTKFD